jgi:2-desacetyl-2-hydroxyethyl bacteriochlorophyllide A dehydrogenase
MSIIHSRIYELSSPKNLYLKEEAIELNSIFPEEVVAETLHSAISPGTELGAYIGSQPLRPGNFYPRVSGYCNVAKIIAVGSAVEHLRPNDLILTLQSHRSSFKMNQQDVIVKIDEGIDPKLASTAYLFHLGYHSLITANAKLEDKVAVIGLGVLGYTTTLMAKNLGCEVVVFTDQSEIQGLLSKEGFTTSSKREPTANLEFEVVINTSNKWDDWLLAMKIVKRSGVIINLGFPGRDEPLLTFNPLDPTYIYFKHLTIKALCFLEDWQKKNNLQYILGLIKSGMIDPTSIISAEVNYTELGKQYENYLKRNSPMFTSILNWK